LSRSKLAILGQTVRGHDVAVLADGKIRFGELRDLKEGMPINDADEIIKLSQCDDSPVIWNIDEQISLRNGPLKVTSNSYRENYDRIFTKSTKSEFTN
jgi:hypothetical protein